MNQQLDYDQLNNLDFQNYGYPTFNIPQYYNPKPDTYQSLPLPIPTTTHTEPQTHNTETLNTSENLVNADTKNDTEKKPTKSKRKKHLWSEKITDASFPFYGCSICNVSYTVLSELDQHVTKHKNRLTSYRLRVRNQLKKKKLKKEKKRLKKLVKVKTEFEVDVEIKPEDGYIGNEKAAEFTGNGGSSSNPENSGYNQHPESTSLLPLNSGTENYQNPETNIPLNPENTSSFNIYQNSDQNTSNISSDVCNTSSDNQNTNVNSGDTTTGRCNSDKEKDDLDDYEKIYKCFACQKKFQLSYYLKLHVRSHTDEKPYACSACDQKFITASHLGRHNKRMHLAARYQCRICFKIFSRFELLTAHFDKKHADDKLDGEPYDYNAILPYLKDLEEQLRQQTEANNKEKNASEPWPSAGLESGQDSGQVTSQPDCQKPEPTPEIKAEASTEDFGYQFLPEDKTGLEPELDDSEVKYEQPENIGDEQNYDHYVDHQNDEQYDDHQNDEQYDDHQNYDQQNDDHQNHDDRNDEQNVDEQFGDDEYKPPREVKDENSSSDEDYFPSNTWLTTPADYPPPPPPPPPSPPPSPPGNMKPRRKIRGSKFCEICQKELSSASYMTIHMRTHTGEKPYKCHKCGSAFITSSKLHRHVMSKHTDKSSKSKSADVKSETEENNEETVAVSSDEDYFPSNTWLTTPADYPPPPPPPPGNKKPRRKIRGSKFCEICKKEVSSASYMTIHMRTHTGEKPYKCHKCGSAFITSGKLHRHVMSKHTDKSSISKSADVKSETEENNEETVAVNKKKHRKSHRHACEFCKQKFYHLHMLEVHKKSHEGQTPELQCDYCLEEFKELGALREHEATHVGPRPYLCTICKKTYMKRVTMLYHRKDHEPDKEFICDICSKRFNAHCKLRKHIVTHRRDKYVLRYECPVCAHMFNTKWHTHMHLGTHMKEGLILEENRAEILAMVLQNARKIPKNADAPSNLTDIMPSDERSRVCNICGEVFQHFYYLEEHLKSHGSKIALNIENDEEERKHICPICSKGFKLHYYLKLHSYTHSKEKPFVCQQCGKGFITRGKLKRHMETHTGLKKYQCHICYKFFSRSSYLRIHIRTIHGTQDFNFSKNYFNWQANLQANLGENSV